MTKIFKILTVFRRFHARFSSASTRIKSVSPFKLVLNDSLIHILCNPCVFPRCNDKMFSHTYSGEGDREYNINDYEDNLEDDCENYDEQELTCNPLFNDINRFYRLPVSGQIVLLIQPRKKSGLNWEKKSDAELKLAEAVALVETLPDWKVFHKIVVPVLSYSSSVLFGKGNVEMLKVFISQNPNISGIFIGKDILSAKQNRNLEDCFGIPIYDRYQIVLRIFHDHARTKEAKLQIALAEIPYLRIKLALFAHNFDYSNFEAIGMVGGSGETFMETRRRILFERELKLKRALEKIKKQRYFLRQNKKRKSIPTVAVVGYTNCGKTSLIKSLTNDKRLVPEDKLFATLDVTLHAGLLPSTQRVLYVDTVGFISDVPTALIHSFKSTLEDVALSDLIVHVRDISHPDTEKQKRVVLETLADLELSPKLLDSIVEVGNKVDLVESSEEIEEENILLISATEGTGLKTLTEDIEEKVLRNTGHSVKLLKVPNGGTEYRWLYKEAVIRDAMVDHTDSNFLIVETVISIPKFEKFKHNFGDLSVTIAYAASGF